MPSAKRPRLYSKRFKNIYRYHRGGTWYVRRSIGGKGRIEEPLHTTDEAEASLRANAKINELNKGKKKASSDLPKTFDQLAELYFSKKTNRSKSYREKCRNILFDHMSPHLGPTLISELTETKLEAYIEIKHGEGYAVADHISILHGLIELARDIRAYERPEQIKLRDPAPASGRGRTLERPELARLLWATRSHVQKGAKVFKPDRDSALRIRMQYRMGLRQGEANGFRFSWINWGTGWAYLPPQAIKTKKTEDRAFPIPKPIFRVMRIRFEKRKRGTDFLFPNAMDPGKPVKSYKTAFRGALRRAKLSYARPHHLRHTAISFMLEAGHPAVFIKKLLGVSEQVMKRYTHVSQAAAVAIMNTRVVR
jgi:integrase